MEYLSGLGVPMKLFNLSFSTPPPNILVPGQIWLVSASLLVLIVCGNLLGVFEIITVSQAVGILTTIICSTHKMEKLIVPNTVHLEPNTEPLKMALADRYR